MKILLLLPLIILGCSNTKEPLEEKVLDTVYGVFCVGPLGSPRCEGRPQGCLVEEFKGFDTLPTNEIFVNCFGEWHPYRYDLEKALHK